jgi:hypothetical protein
MTPCIVDESTRRLIVLLIITDGLINGVLPSPIDPYVLPACVKGEFLRRGTLSSPPSNVRVDSESIVANSPGVGVTPLTVSLDPERSRNRNDS